MKAFRRILIAVSITCFVASDATAITPAGTHAQLQDYHFLASELPDGYACRAGFETRFHYGNDLNYSQFGQYAWYVRNSSGRTHTVGQKKPNSFGLYDIYGNVLEWCSDWYADNYRNAVIVDPEGPKSGEYRVLRGGGWTYDAENSRSATRRWNTPDDRSFLFGFRIVLDLN